MFHPTLKHFAVLVVACVSCCFARVPRAAAGEPIMVSTGDVCDAECEETRPCCTERLCRKLKLHCIYFRQSCCRRYVALPYTEPCSSMYYCPGMNGYEASCPTGAMSFGYPGSYGYGNAGYTPQPYAAHPALAPPGSVFIR
ncbi:MAG: hypothetical protein ACM3U2_17270 [Deltaproteobacteria bacterium]